MSFKSKFTYKNLNNHKKIWRIVWNAHIKVFQFAYKLFRNE